MRSVFRSVCPVVRLDGEARRIRIDAHNETDTPASPPGLGRGRHGVARPEEDRPSGRPHPATLLVLHPHRGRDRCGCRPFHASLCVTSASLGSRFRRARLHASPEPRRDASIVPAIEPLRAPQIIQRRQLRVRRLVLLQRVRVRKHIRLGSIRFSVLFLSDTNHFFLLFFDCAGHRARRTRTPTWPRGLQRREDFTHARTLQVLASLRRLSSPRHGDEHLHVPVRPRPPKERVIAPRPPARRQARPWPYRGARPCALDHNRRPSPSVLELVLILIGVLLFAPVSRPSAGSDASASPFVVLLETALRRTTPQERGRLRGGVVAVDDRRARRASVAVEGRRSSSRSWLGAVGGGVRGVSARSGRGRGGAEDGGSGGRFAGEERAKTLLEGKRLDVGGVAGGWLGDVSSG